jgi:hypothetical protein
VLAGIESKGSIEQWWATCERYHRNEDALLDDEEDQLVPIHMPFSQTRQDMLTSQVCTVITKQKPLMLAEVPGGLEQKERLEKTVDKFWQSARFDVALRSASSVCTDTNIVWYRLAWDSMIAQKKPFGGIVFEAIHPKHCVIYPATRSGIAGARLLGHRFYRRLKDVRILQQSGYYFNDRPATGGNIPETTDTTGDINNAGSNPGVSSTDPGDMLVELFEVLVRYSPSGLDDENMKPEKWYRGTFEYNTGNLLAFEDYPYSRPWYFDSTYILNLEDGYWPGVSVARNLSGIQDAVDKNETALYNGSMIGCYPPVFGPELPEKDFRYGFGDYVPTDAPANSFFSPTIRPVLGPLNENLARYDNIGDKTARVSANTMGAPTDHATTATEQSIIASGVAVGLEEYIGNFSYSLGDMAAFTCELLSEHWTDWSSLYAAATQVQQTDLVVPQIWEPNGKKPGNTASARLSGLQTVAEIAKTFGPSTGIDPYAFMTAVLANLEMTGADNIQIPKEQMIANQQAQAAAELGAPAGVPPGQGANPQPGMGAPPELPPQEMGGVQPPMPPLGP